MSELTGEQLTEKFFTEVKGYGQTSSDWGISKDGKYTAIGKGQFPPLHLKFEGLGLQEEWLRPELRKKGFNMVRFIEDDVDSYECAIWGVGIRIPHVGDAPTKALAQLEAGLKALGVI